MMKQAAPRSSDASPIDAGLRALCGIAAYYRIGADPIGLQRRAGARGVGRPTNSISFAPPSMIGLRARLVTGASARRMGKLPTPAIVRLKSGALFVYAGRVPSGLCRLVDPISHAVMEIPLEELARESGGQALLVARRVGGAGVDPKTFGMRWFLPTLWRYRQPLGHVLAASLFVQIFALTTPLIFQVDRRQGADAQGLRDPVRDDRRPRGDRPVRRRAAISAHLRAVAHHQPHRRRTRPAAVRPSPAAADELFRDAPGRTDGRPGARARDDPRLPDRAGAVFGDRPRLHLRLLRGDVRLFDEPHPDRADRPAGLRADRLPGAAAAARSGQREVQPRRGEPAVPGRDHRRRRHGQGCGGRTDHARAVGGEARRLREDELRRDHAGLRAVNSPSSTSAS